MDTQLRSAIDGLYVAFKRKAPRNIEGCPCCIGKHDIDGLINAPLRELSEATLSSYTASLFLTVGALGDYKYFLPRISEVAVTESGGWPSTEIVLGKLGLAEWRLWPKAEARAVEAFLDAWFDAVASAAIPPEHGMYYGPPIDTLICGLGRSGVPLAPYLTRLFDYPNALASLYFGNMDTLTDGKLEDPFWDDAPEAMAEVVAFLQRDDVLEVATR